MSAFEVLIREVDDVIDHPNADRLSILKILGYCAIAAKNEDGSHRFEPGEAIVYVPENAIVPEDVLKEYGYWNEEKDIGMLAGKLGNRVKAIRLRGTLSQGLVLKTDYRKQAPLTWQEAWGVSRRANPDNGRFADDHPKAGEIIPSMFYGNVGHDVADFLGITKWEPEVPAGMGGEVVAASEFAYNYDIENFQTYPTFLVEDIVEVTEKLHGTNFRISYRPGVENPDLFGEGNIAICSKGLGAKGLCFKNTESNVYVRAAIELDLIWKLDAVGERLGVPIDLFGEVYGVGVQDLHYGTTKPEFRAFDVRVNGEFLNSPEKAEFFKELGVQQVPVLYRGPFDLDLLTELRDGTTSVNRKMDAQIGPCIREGIIVTAVDSQTPRQADIGHTLRPILKMVSPEYLTRKGGTEFN